MKHYLFLILLIICGTSIYAQHLNEEEFQKAHDRIVIAFTKAILPDYVKTLPKEEQTKYAQFIRKKLMKGEISNVNELDTLLRNNKFPDFADKFIGCLRMEYQSLTTKKLYDSLCNKLRETGNIQKFIQYNEITFASIFPEATTGSSGQSDEEEIQSEKKGPTQNVLAKRSPLNNRRNNLSTTGLAVSGGALLLFVILIGCFFSLRRKLNRLEEQMERERRKKRTSELEVLQNNVESLRSRIEQLELQIKNIQSRIKELTFRTTEEVTDVRVCPPSSNIPPQPVLENKDVIYAELKNRQLEKVTEKDRKYYKITREPDGKRGSFELINDSGMIVRAIRSKEDYIEPACETHGNASMAKNVRTIAPGKVSTTDGETWIIEKKAQIEYIS